jgi:hypothetical protein
MSFKTSLSFEQVIDDYSDVILSLSQNHAPKKKDLLGTEHTKKDRKTPTEHLQQLISQKRLQKEVPLMVISCRNVLSNFRCIAYIKDLMPEPLSVLYENPNQSKRAYHILGQKQGKLCIETWNPSKSSCKDYDWFISGVPVLWDDIDPQDLYKKIVTEAADHSHVWVLPRGNHPDATDESRSLWQEIQNIFQVNVHDSRDNAYAAIEKCINKHTMTRETNYLHNILGLDNQGNLCQLVETGKLEDLGQKLAKRNVKRALCVDNSGSITIQFYKKGFPGEACQLAAAPNQRPPGTAYLVVVLPDAGFGSL